MANGKIFVRGSKRGIEWAYRPGGGDQAVDLSVLPLNEDRLLFKRDSMTGRKSKARRRDDTA